jgi:hypothetical protein
MVPTDNSKPDESRRQDIVDAENRRNRSIIADAVKQMVLIIISLGFSNAYTIVSKSDDKVLHFFSATCETGAKCHHVSGDSLLMFAIYVLIGTRFLLTSWLYLSTTYRDDNPKKLRILPDAIGIFLTGVFIGVQSSYASAQWIPDFFMLFCLILLIDVVSSLASLGMNWRAVKHEGLAQEIAWIGNNFAFGIATFVAVLKSPPFDPIGSGAHLLMPFALLNCAISFGISWFGYFRAKRVAPKRLDHDLVAVVLAKRDGSIRVEEARRWLSAAIARDRH